MAKQTAKDLKLMTGMRLRVKHKNNPNPFWVILLLNTDLGDILVSSNNWLPVPYRKFPLSRITLGSLDQSIITVLKIVSPSSNRAMGNALNIDDTKIRPQELIYSIPDELKLEDKIKTLTKLRTDFSQRKFKSDCSMCNIIKSNDYDTREQDFLFNLLKERGDLMGKNFSKDFLWPKDHYQPRLDWINMQIGKLISV